MNCFSCCMSEEKIQRRSLKKSIQEFKKSIQEHQDTKAIASFANISLKTGIFFLEFLSISMFFLNPL